MLTFLVAVASSAVVRGEAHGQGLIIFQNTSTTLVRTNSVGLGGTVGDTSPTTGGFAFGLFIAPSTVTSLSPTDLLSPTWTFTGLYASNFPTSTAGRLYGGQGVQVPGWDDMTNSFVVVGWSANIAWTDWNAVAAQLSGASLNNGVWAGPNWLPGSIGGFFGVSPVGYGTAPDPIHLRPGFPLFGVPYAEGVPISTGFDLYSVNTPEPSVLALAVIGGAAIIGFRLRNLFGRQ